MNRRLFTGSGVALVTPFTRDGVDFDAYGRLIDFQIAGGTDALIACGTTGEPSTMTSKEKEQVIGYAISRAAGRVPVIAGTGCNDTRESIEQSKHAQAMGADALLVVTPYYNKTTQPGLIAHYRAIADAVTIPVIVYNVPTRTGLNMLPQTFATLAEHENICGMKEASANIEQITELMRLCGERVALYSGNDDHVVPLLSLGGQGVISVVANIAPRDTHDMVVKYLSGDLSGSLELQFRLNPLTKQLFSEVNPIPVKTALSLMGMCGGELRLPLVPMEAANLEKLKAAMRTYGLIA